MRRKKERSKQYMYVLLLFNISLASYHSAQNMSGSRDYFNIYYYNNNYNSYLHECSIHYIHALAGVGFECHIRWS